MAYVACGAYCQAGWPLKPNPASVGPIPQNAEYVFRDVPLVKMRLDYDTKNWDARLVPGEGQTQRLIVRNKSSGPQKRCVVRPRRARSR